MSPLWGSNPRPYAYEAHALPTELRRHCLKLRFQPSPRAREASTGQSGKGTEKDKEVGREDFLAFPQNPPHENVRGAGRP